jgi:hypothetical protein
MISSYDDERRQRRLAEMELGRRMTMTNMAQGLIDTLQKDYKIPAVVLKNEPKDIREWTVLIDMGEAGEYEENFWEFPSDRLKTMLMLLNK